MPIGKVPVDLLRHLLARFAKSRDPCVVAGAGIGLDAAAIRIGSKVLVAKTDPITFVADEIGTYALLINANDLAAAGATPKWFLATLLLPRSCHHTIFRHTPIRATQYDVPPSPCVVVRRPQ